jgi:hypothetical protein
MVALEELEQLEAAERPEALELDIAREYAA